MAIVAEYDTKKDERGRVTLKRAEAEYYHVQVREDGSILLTPQVLAPAAISLRTLHTLDQAMEHLRAGVVGAAVDADALLAALGDTAESE